MIRTDRHRTFFLEDSKTLFGRTFLEVFQFSEDKAAVRDRKGAYYIGTDGRPVFKTVFREAYPFIDGKAAVRDDLGMFHIGPDGSELYRHRFQWVSVFREGMCAVCNRNGTYAYLDHDFLLSDRRFRYASDFHEGLASVLIDEGFVFVDKTLEQAFEGIYQYAGPFTDGKAPVVIDGKWYLIDHDGISVSEAYDHISDSVEGMRKARSGDDSGVFGKNGWVRLYTPGKVFGERMPVWTDDILDREWDSCLVFFRHSERTPHLLSDRMLIESGALTPEGCDLARHIGEKIRSLSDKKISVYSSRVTRCITTANCVLGGMGVSCGVTIAQEIGPMGRAFVGDYEFTDDDFIKPAQLSCVDCMKGIPVKGWYSLDTMRENILRYFLSLMGDGTLTLCVSHDLFVSLITAALSRRYPEHEWPDYCDGALLIKRKGRILMVWKGKEYPLDEGFGPMDCEPMPTGRALEKMTDDLPFIDDRSADSVAWSHRSSDDVYSVADREGRFYHVRADGYRCHCIVYDFVGDMESEIAPVYVDGRGATHATDFGDFLHNRWFLDCEGYSEGLAAVRTKDGWDYIDVDGKPVIRLGAGLAGRFVHGRAFAMVDGKPSVVGRYDKKTTVL